LRPREERTTLRQTGRRKSARGKRKIEEGTRVLSRRGKNNWGKVRKGWGEKESFAKKYQKTFTLEDKKKGGETCHVSLKKKQKKDTLEGCVESNRRKRKKSGSHSGGICQNGQRKTPNSGTKEPSD